MESWSPVTFHLAAQLYARMIDDPFVEALEADVQMRLQSPGVRETWIALRENEIVAALDCEMLNGSAWISIWVSPAMRRQRVGSRALEVAEAWASRNGAAKLCGTVDPANLASLALLRAASFVISSTVDEEGLLYAERDIVNPPLQGTSD